VFWSINAIADGPRAGYLGRYSARTALNIMLRKLFDIVAREFGPAQETTELHEAVRSGDVNRIRAILSTRQGARLINYRTKNLHTPLHLCLKDPEIATILLGAGADPHIRGTMGSDSDSVFHVLARHASKQVIVTVISHGADIHIKDEFGNTTLHEAAELGNVGAAEALLDAGVPVDVRNQRHHTPLHVAMAFTATEARVRIQIARLLLDRGAAVNAMDKHGQSPLTLAIQDYATYDRPLASPSEIDLLIERGASLDVRPFGNSLLDYARYRIEDTDGPKRNAEKLIKAIQNLGAK